MTEKDPSHPFTSINDSSTADPQAIPNEDLKPAVSIVTPGSIALRPTPVPKNRKRIQ